MNSVQRQIGMSTPSGLQSGFSLVEVLVALLVLSIGLLGLAGLQTYGLAYSHESYERTQATLLLDNVIDDMRANYNALGSYAVSVNASTGTLSPSCTPSGGVLQCSSPTAMANYDINQWIAFLQKTLYSGGVTIASNSTYPNTYTVTVSWTEKNLPLQESETVQLY